MRHRNPLQVILVSGTARLEQASRFELSLILLGAAGVRSAEAGGSAGAGFGGFGFAVAMGSGGFEPSEQARGNAGDVINGGVEGGFVGFGGMVHAGDFSDELEGSGADFVGCDRWIEVEKSFDVAAHGCLQWPVVRVQWPV